MAILRRPVLVRFTDAPAVTDGGATLPLAFRVTTRRPGPLRCEASLWCTLVTPRGGVAWPPEARRSAEVTKVVVDLGDVAAGQHERSVELAVPADVRPSVETPAGKVRYEVNVVAVLDRHRAVANRPITVHATDATSWVEETLLGDGPWGVEVAAQPARPGEGLVATVRVDPRGWRGSVEVAARLERFEETFGREPVGRWSTEVTLGRDVALEPGRMAALPLRIELPGDAVPTVMTATFAERWLLTVTVSDGSLVRQLATGVAVVG